MGGNGYSKGIYYTSSWQLADDVCRLILHCGFAFAGTGENFHVGRGRMIQIVNHLLLKQLLKSTFLNIRFLFYTKLLVLRLIINTANHAKNMMINISIMMVIFMAEKPYVAFFFFFVRHDGIGILTAGVVHFKTDKALDATKESREAQLDSTKVVRLTDYLSSTQSSLFYGNESDEII